MLKHKKVGDHHLLIMTKDDLKVVKCVLGWASWYSGDVNMILKKNGFGMGWEAMTNDRRSALAARPLWPACLIRYQV